MTRILLVADNPDLRYTIGQILRAEDYQVRAAGDGTAAVDMAVAWEPDVVVFDVVAPLRRGVSFLDRYLRLPGPNAPILAVAAPGPDADLAESIGAARVLLKTPDVHELTSAVTHLTLLRRRTRYKGYPYAA